MGRHSKRGQIQLNIVYGQVLYENRKEMADNQFKGGFRNLITIEFHINLQANHLIYFIICNFSIKFSHKDSWSHQNQFNHQFMDINLVKEQRMKASNLGISTSSIGKHYFSNDDGNIIDLASLWHRMPLSHCLQVKRRLILQQICPLLGPLHYRFDSTDHIAPSHHQLPNLLFPQVVPKSIRGQDYSLLTHLCKSKLVVAAIKYVRHWLFLIRIRIALGYVILSSEDLKRNVELSLLLLSDEAFTRLPENTEDRVPYMIASQNAGMRMQGND